MSPYEQHEQEDHPVRLLGGGGGDHTHTQFLAVLLPEGMLINGIEIQHLKIIGHNFSFVGPITLIL